MTHLYISWKYNVCVLKSTDEYEMYFFLTVTEFFASTWSKNCLGLINNPVYTLRLGVTPVHRSLPSAQKASLHWLIHRREMTEVKFVLTWETKSSCSHAALTLQAVQLRVSQRTTTRL